MLTPKIIIDRVKEEFGCFLKEQRLLDMLNSLETKLALEVFKESDVLMFEGGQSQIALPEFYGYISEVYADNIKLSKNLEYKVEENILKVTGCYKNITVKYIKTPKPFTLTDYTERALLLGEENSEVYVFYLLSREALINEDIERVNNYSALYSEALKNLSIVKKDITKFKNIW